MRRATLSAHNQMLVSAADLQGDKTALPEHAARTICLTNVQTRTIGGMPLTIEGNLALQS
jgi:hypothetical protein